MIDSHGNTGFPNCFFPSFHYNISQSYLKMQTWERCHFAGYDFLQSGNWSIWYKIHCFSILLGIASRNIKPTLGLIDPEHTLHMPERVVANSGFDVLWWVNRSPYYGANLRAKHLRIPIYFTVMLWNLTQQSPIICAVLVQPTQSTAQLTRGAIPLAMCGLYMPWKLSPST